MDAYFENSPYMVTSHLTGYQILYSDDNWQHQKETFLVISKDENIIQVIRDHLIRVYVNSLFQYIPRVIKTKKPFPYEIAINYLYSKGISIPPTTIIYDTKTFYDVLFASTNKQLEDVYVYDFVEAPKCAGCRQYIESGYTRLSKHQSVNGCLNTKGSMLTKK